jgi:hypothetical protein
VVVRACVVARGGLAAFPRGRCRRGFALHAELAREGGELGYRPVQTLLVTAGAEGEPARPPQPPRARITASVVVTAATLRIA